MKPGGVVHGMIVIHVCGPDEINMVPHQEDDTPVEVWVGRCPVQDSECEFGCEMGCQLDGLSPEDVARMERVIP